MRVSKGVYTLRAFAPPSPPPPPTKAKGQRTVRPPPPRFDPSAFPEPTVAYEVGRCTALISDDGTVSQEQYTPHACSMHNLSTRVASVCGDLCDDGSFAERHVPSAH